jgi:hypothetical protein
MHVRNMTQTPMLPARVDRRMTRLTFGFKLQRCWLVEKFDDWLFIFLTTT